MEQPAAMQQEAVRKIGSANYANVLGERAAAADSTVARITIIITISH